MLCHFDLKHGTAALGACAQSFLKSQALASDIVMVEPENIQRAGRASLTTETLLPKRQRRAKEAEDTVQRGLGFDEMEVDFGCEEEALVSKAFMDNMEAEAHANNDSGHGLRTTHGPVRQGLDRTAGQRWTAPHTTCAPCAPRDLVPAPSYKAGSHPIMEAGAEAFPTVARKVPFQAVPAGDRGHRIHQKRMGTTNNYKLRAYRTASHS